MSSEIDDEVDRKDRPENKECDRQGDDNLDVGHDWKTNGTYPIRRSHVYDGGCRNMCSQDHSMPFPHGSLYSIFRPSRLTHVFVPLCFFHYLHVFHLCFSDSFDSCFSRCSDSYVLSCSILFYTYYYFLFSRVV